MRKLTGNSVAVPVVEAVVRSVVDVLERQPNPRVVQHTLLDEELTMI